MTILVDHHTKKYDCLFQRYQSDAIIHNLLNKYYKHRGHHLSAAKVPQLGWGETTKSAVSIWYEQDFVLPCFRVVISLFSVVLCNIIVFKRLYYD